MALYIAEHAPNPWVRAVAIVVVGAYGYFWAPDAGVPPQHEWIGHYGLCGDEDEFGHWY